MPPKGKSSLRTARRDLNSRTTGRETIKEGKGSEGSVERVRGVKKNSKVLEGNKRNGSEIAGQQIRRSQEYCGDLGEPQRTPSKKQPRGPA